MAAPGVQQLTLDLDKNMTPAGGRIFATNVDNLKLTISTNKAWTIPAGTNKVFFRANADCWVLMNSAAAVPAGDVIDGTGSELISSGQGVWISFTGTDTTLNIISAAAALISLTRYSN